MDIKYNVSKIKSSKEEIVKDAVSVEEPLEMRLKYKKNGKIETQNISITMRTPGNDEDLIRGFLFNERIIENMDEIDSIQHIGCLLYTSPSPRDGLLSRMPSSA